MSKKAPLINKTSETLAEMHNKNITTLDLVESKKSIAPTDLIQKAYKSAAEGLKEAIACGDADAAPLVAYLQANGLGCKKSLLKPSIWVELGAQLGNKACQTLKQGFNPDSSDERMTSLWHSLYDTGGTPDHVFSVSVVSMGTLHANAIRENIEKYNTKSAVLTSRTVINCIKHFEHSDVGLYVYNEDGYSFPETESNCCWLWTRAICCCLCVSGDHTQENDDLT